MRIEKGQRASR